MDVHVQFQLTFEYFNVLGSIHSGVRRNGIQTSSAMARHGTPNHLVRRVFHCCYNIFLVKTLMCMWRGTNCCIVHSSENITFFQLVRFQWRWRLAKSSLIFFIRCSFHAGLWDISPNSLLICLETVLEHIDVHFKWNIAWFVLQELFGECVTDCLTERPSLGLNQCVRIQNNAKRQGAGRSSEVERSLMVRWVTGSILHGVDPLSYFSFQPVLHNWCNKGHGMCYPVCGMVHIKEPLLLIDKSSLCGGSVFPFSLSEWSLTICLTPYNRR